MPKHVSAEQHQKQKKRYYKKHRVYNKRHGLPYTELEKFMIENKTAPDVTLAKGLQRSLAAIQLKRNAMLEATK